MSIEILIFAENAHAPSAEILNGFLDLHLAVHHEWSISRDGSPMGFPAISNRLTGSDAWFVTWMA